MTIRPYRTSDANSLKAMEGSFPYVEPDSPFVEACLVIENEQGDVIAAAAAKRIVELYFWKEPLMRPALTLSVIRHMHEAMASELRQLGYDEANTFLHPSICERFGRRLQRSFNWVRNWPSFAVKF